MNQQPNALLQCSSPYLQQHAYNPVNWFPWGEEALAKAKEEQKLLLISVGYSACHWCHVMEHESFEDEEIATVMNKFFVCIKVDREERPDIDHIYMEAVQLMTGRGGWPLNCIALPDQRPLYGGTYFPKEQWRSVLLQLAQLWREDKERCFQYASELTEGVQRMAFVPADAAKGIEEAELSEMVRRWSLHFDSDEGGPQRAPKFPLPDTYLFLLKYAHGSRDAAVRSHVELTLKKMAYGGIYDHLGGGFARYSTDMLWKVPHFEKMLYDNAQLITLYTAAYRAYSNPLYKEVVADCIGFLDRDFKSPQGAYYAAMDADSEGEEGRFYTWTKEEVEAIAGSDAALFSDYFNVNQRGFWEHERYILLRHDDDAKVAARQGMSLDDMRQRINVMKEKFLDVRAARVKPGVDNKVITCWNALLIKALAEAALAFDRPDWLEAAQSAAAVLMRHVLTPAKRLLHGYAEKRGVADRDIPAFLDDYAAVMDALITLYESSFEESYLQQAKQLAEQVLQHFLQSESGLFYYTADDAEELIARKIDVQDNVIPSGNAIMCHNLIRLARHFEIDAWEEQALLMLKRVLPLVKESTPWYAHWAQALMLLQAPRVEIVFTGPNVYRELKAFHRSFQPACIIAGSMTKSELPLLKDRVDLALDRIYVCRNKSCHLPVSKAEEALLLIN